MTMSTSLVVFDELTANVKLYLEPAKDIVVADVASREAALEAVKNIKALSKLVTAKRVELVKPHNDFCSDVNAKAGGLTGPLDAMEKEIKLKITKYESAQEAIRVAERQRIENERIAKEKVIEDERRAKELAERQAREKEEARIRTELKAVADAEAKERREAEEMFGAADAAEKAKAAVDLAAQIAKADQDAKDRREAALKQQAIDDARHAREKEERDAQAKRAAAALDAEKIKGLKRKWTHEITDLTHGTIPRQYLSLDQTKIRAAIADGVREIPGIRIFQIDELAVRGAGQKALA
jgi:hypothetical protein